MIKVQFIISTWLLLSLFPVEAVRERLTIGLHRVVWKACAYNYIKSIGKRQQKLSGFHFYLKTWVALTHGFWGGFGCMSVESKWEMLDAKFHLITIGYCLTLIHFHYPSILLLKRNDGKKIGNTTSPQNWQFHPKAKPVHWSLGVPIASLLFELCPFQQ